MAINELRLMQALSELAEENKALRSELQSLKRVVARHADVITGGVPAAAPFRPVNHVGADAGYAAQQTSLLRTRLKVGAAYRPDQPASFGPIDQPLVPAAPGTSGAVEEAQRAARAVAARSAAPSAMSRFRDAQDDEASTEAWDDA